MNNYNSNSTHETKVQNHTNSKMQGQVTISNARQQYEWNKNLYWQNVYIFPLA
jgi:hypothetical protein